MACVRALTEELFVAGEAHPLVVRIVREPIRRVDGDAVPGRVAAVRADWLPRAAALSFAAAAAAAAGLLPTSLGLVLLRLLLCKLRCDCLHQYDTGCIVDISWMYLGCVRDVSGMYPGYIRDVSRECVRDVSWMYPGSFRGMYPGCIRHGSGMDPGWIRDRSEIYSGSIRDLSGIYPRDISRMYPGRIRYGSGMYPG